MDKNYIYIIRRREHVRIGEDIYKIGHTTRGIDRLKEYDNGVGIEIHGMFPVVNSKEAERSVIELFNSKYGRIDRTESYKGNVEDMVKDIKNVCKEHNTSNSISQTMEEHHNRIHNELLYTCNIYNEQYPYLIDRASDQLQKIKDKRRYALPVEVANIINRSKKHDTGIELEQSAPSYQGEPMDHFVLSKYNRFA
jgi:hypothetical protein